MTTRSQLREELLEQHSRLRELAAEVHSAAQRTLEGDGAAQALLRTHLERLLAALNEHNARENQALGEFLATVDAWGPERESLMHSRHASEHESIAGAVREACAAPNGAQAARVALAALTEMSSHMEREEREILHPDVLRDDIITVGFGG